VKLINDQLNAIFFLNKEVDDLSIMIIILLILVIALFIYWIWWIYSLRALIRHTLKVEKHFLNSEVWYLQVLKKIFEKVGESS